MPKRKKSSKVKYSVDVSFEKKNNNLPQILSRFKEKVEQNNDAESIALIEKRLKELEK